MNKQVPIFQAMVRILKLRISTIHTLTLKVPVERDSAHDEANERKRGVELIWR
jgi:hypothetical protein